MYRNTGFVIGGYSVNKKIKTTIVSFIAMVVVIVIALFAFSNRSYSVKITNGLEKTSIPMKIETKEGVTLSSVAEIPSKGSWKEDINLEDVEKETSIVLVHTNYDGRKFTETLSLNVKSGFKGKVKVKITGIDEEGKMIFEVK